MKKRGFRKILSVMCAIIILLSLISFAGCASDGNDGDDTVTPSNITPTDSQQEITTQNIESTSDKPIVLGEKVLATPIDYNSASGTYPTSASGEFQSIKEYCGKGLTYKEIKEEAGSYIIEFEGKADAIKSLEEYKKLMIGGKMHFEASGEAKQVKDGKTYLGFGFDYNGAIFVQKNNLINYSDKNLPCTISFSYYTNGVKVRGILRWPKELKSTDLGFRASEKNESDAPAGASACAGLKRTAGGAYETDDGRFSLRMGETVIYTNGNIFGGKATLILDRNKTCHLIIKTTDGKESTVFSFPYSDFNSGAYYNETALSLYTNPVKEKSPVNFSTEKATLFRNIDSEWYNPTYQNSKFEKATVRIVYLSKEENIAVFYIYSETDIEQEIMCVLDISKAQKPDKNTSVIPVETTAPSETTTKKP